MLDKLNYFEPSARAVTTATTYTSTDKWDTQGGTSGGLVRNLGIGKPLFVVIRVGTVFAGGTSCDFRLVCDDNTSLSSPTTLASTGAIATASLTAGATFVITFPNAHTYERYIGVNAVSVGTHTTGDYIAFVTDDPGQYRAYADNVTY